MVDFGLCEHRAYLDDFCSSEGQMLAEFDNGVAGVDDIFNKYDVTPVNICGKTEHVFDVSG